MVVSCSGEVDSSGDSDVDRIEAGVCFRSSDRMDGFNLKTPEDDLLAK
jgi:hypothetical protein